MVQSKSWSFISFKGVVANHEQIWEFFLAYSTITSRQGGATCYQITLVKNINSTHRIEAIHTQFSLIGALEAAKAKGKALFSNGSQEKVSN